MINRSKTRFTMRSGAGTVSGLAATMGSILAMTGACLGVAGSLALPAQAKPPAPAAFCSTYPEAKACQIGAAECTTCHSVAPARNRFGEQLSERLAPGVTRPLSDSDFLRALPGALKAVESLDSDDDGFSNIAEILAGSRLADRSSIPRTASCSSEQQAASASGAWNFCGYDPEFAFRRVHMDFCGTAPTKAALAAYRKTIADETAWKTALSDTLDACLKSRNWVGVNGAVWNLANAKIRPASTTKSGANAGPIPLGDYDDDYNLFVYANSGDRDVRDLLLAQYFVKRVSDNPVKLEVIPEEELARRGRAEKQPVEVGKRAGMITTRWFSAHHTMFTPIPRTTAAQAYRSYLGFDVAKMQGLDPIPHEPADYDIKGVGAPECAICHSTLDPLTYPFSRYNGISGGATYDQKRLNAYVRSDGPKVATAPEQGVIFGQKVNNLVEWAQVAANSDPFAKKVTFDYWKLLVGREPTIQDQPEYNQLWRDLKSPTVHNYRVEDMLHALILTNAYGRP